MNKYRLIITLLVICVFEIMGGTSSHAQEKQPLLEKGAILKFSAVDQVSERPKVTLLNILSVYGEAYDCVFTIEEVWEDSGLINPLSGKLVEMTSTEQDFHQDLKSDLDALEQLIPNVKFEINQSNPRIIHIIDARLAQQKGYGLESVIPSINFKGTVVDLINEIGAQGVPISFPHVRFNGEMVDFSTKLRVKGERLKVRDVLSNFIKLEGRSEQIIWIARTKLGQEITSTVHFRGRQEKD